MIRSTVLLTLALVTIAGVFLRLYDLGEESMWLDEVTAVNRANGSIEGILDTESHDPNPPLYYLMLRSWMRWFGTSEWGARSLSALLGVLCIPAVFLVARELFDEEIGLLSSLVVSVSRFQIAYSQEARMYAGLSLFALLSIYAFLRIIRSPAKRDYLLYVAATSALIYVHVYGLFIVLFQNAWFLLFAGYRRVWRRWLLVEALVGAIFAPWIPGLVHHVLRPEARSWIPVPNAGTAFDALAAYVGGSEWKIVLFTALGVIGVLTFRRKAGEVSLRCPLRSLAGLEWSVKISNPSSLLLMVMWGGSVTAVPMAISVLVSPIFVVRYSIAACFPIYILVARSFLSFPSRTIRAVLLSALLVASTASLVPYYSADQKEQWREVADTLEAAEEAGEPILVNPPGWAEPLLYYFEEGRARVYPFGSTAADLYWVDRAVVTPETLPHMLGESDGFWVAVVYGGSKDYPFGLLEEEYRRDSHQSYVEINLFHYLREAPVD
jgi:uncharacterized membrane protein